MKNNVKFIFIGLVLLLLLGGFFIFLIIYATPYFYSKHPNVSHDSAEDSIEKIIYAVQDTITISNDSVITHRVTLTEPPQPKPSIEPTIENLGTFGDSAGFWNAIFSALAMIAVVITLYYQFHKDRRDEERIAIAQFQDQFFKMVSILSEIVSELRINQNNKPTFTYSIPDNVGYDMTEGNQSATSSSAMQLQAEQVKDITGRACFQYIYHEKSDGKNVGQHLANETRGDQDAIASEELYLSLRKIIGNHFDHYFRTIYRILKFIDDIDLGNCDKEKQTEVKDLCADLLRAQLSTFELALIYYNGLFPQFRNSSKKLYERYCIFNNLDPQILILPSEKNYYEYVCKNHANKEDYNPTIHYDFTAFTSPISPNSTSRFHTTTSRVLRYLWSRLKKLLPRKFRNEATSSTPDQVGTNNDVQTIFSIIKKSEGNILTSQKIQTLGHMSKTRMKVALKYLKANQYISRKTSKDGTIYKVLKNYP